MDVLTKNLRVMDTTAISLAKENNLPIVVFSIKEKGNIAKVLNGESKCTIVKGT